MRRKGIEVINGLQALAVGGLLVLAAVSASAGPADAELFRHTHHQRLRVGDQLSAHVFDDALEGCVGVQRRE